jgi:hypothetical protein
MKKENALETCLIITTGFLLLFYVFEIKAFLLVAFISGIIGIFIRPLALKIAWLWQKLGDLMGLAVSKIVLSLIFFVFLLPISLIYRLIKKDPMMLRNKHDSYWITRNYKYGGKDLENIW